MVSAGSHMALLRSAVGLYSKSYKHVAPPEQIKSKLFSRTAMEVGYDGSCFAPRSLLNIPIWFFSIKSYSPHKPGYDWRVFKSD